MKTGLFFGSFNPIHNGHLIIAEYMATYTDLDEVWLVVSPQNPFKNAEYLADENARLQMVDIAISGKPKLKSCDAEFHLPRPSYTIDTLHYLTEKYPEREWVLVMGTDTAATLPDWKNAEEIMEDYKVYCYQRPEGQERFDNFLKVVKSKNTFTLFADVPLMYISATFLRQSLKSGKLIEHLIPQGVLEFIRREGVYAGEV
ncbi:MAG: nicotinate (nicotinamide) nucleotide adenylyltransferase [Bacteroidetes bacterium]|nr:nicotinate (nicotinamide) nucleotide adenylyltransferase [Bacteroidota bacterium]